MRMSVKGLISRGLLAALAGALPASAAELVPAGPETVMTPSAEGFQYAPSLASLGPAGMVAVWVEDDDTGGAIKARFLDTAGAPVPGEIVLHPGASVLSYLNYPEVAGSPNGSFAAVWVDQNRIVGRHFKSRSDPGTSLRISPSGDRIHRGPSVAMDAAGNFVVVWYEDSLFSLDQRLFVRRFGADGLPLGDPVRVDETLIGPAHYQSNGYPRVAIHSDGSLLVTWDSSGGVRARRFNGPSQTWSSEIEAGYGALAVPVLYPEGDGAIVWVDNGKVRLRAVNGGGAFQDPPVEVGLYSDRTSNDSSSPSVALDRSGNALVLWTTLKPTAQPYEYRYGIQGRLFDRFLQPRGDAFLVTPGNFDESDPAVAASPAGGFVALWTSGYFPPSYFPIPVPTQIVQRHGQDGEGFGVLGRGFAGLCATDAETLCLGPGGRFAARVAWRKRSGEEGTGKPLALSKDTGSFWFFGPDNLELMVKMIDGQEVNGHFWVYSGALSDVEYTLTVRDTVTGAEKSYRNPQGRIASRADVEAFPSAAVLDYDTPVGGAAAALFLGDQGRFRVSVEFHHPLQNDAVVQAKAIPLTGDTGAFWFFNARNIELMIKILDGRSVNGRFWVYYGALSDVRYTITVTDTVTQTTKTYENTPGRLVSRADGEAF
ncbi:MAG TPA: hypothetical protein VF789_08975 [Thermoanaerobaculia bacterium]